MGRKVLSVRMLGGQGAFSSGVIPADSWTRQLRFLHGFTLIPTVLEEMAVASQGWSEGLFREREVQWHLRHPPPQEDTW